MLVQGFAWWFLFVIPMASAKTLRTSTHRPATQVRVSKKAAFQTDGEEVRGFERSKPRLRRLRFEIFAGLSQRVPRPNSYFQCVIVALPISGMVGVFSERDNPNRLVAIPPTFVVLPLAYIVAPYVRMSYG